MENSRDMFLDLTPNGIHMFFLTMAVITFSVKIVRWMNVGQKTSDKFSKLQKRFFTGFVLFNFPVQVIGPFTNSLYSKCGVSSSEKATISIMINITISISSFFVGKIIKFFGHRKSILIATLTSAVANLLRYMGTHLSLKFASLFIGFSAALSKIVLDDFFFTEESEINEPNSSILFSENKSFFSFAIFLASSPIGDGIYKYFSVEKIFLFASVVFTAFSVPLWLLFYPTASAKAKGASDSGFAQTIRNLTHPLFNREFVTFAMVVCYEIIPIIFFSGLSTYFDGLPSGSIAGIFGISKVFGVIILQRLQTVVTSKAKILLLFCAIDVAFFALFARFHSSRDVALACFFAFGAADSVITATLLGFQREHYHAATRATTSGVCKFLTSLVSSALIYALRNSGAGARAHLCAALVAALPALALRMY